MNLTILKKMILTVQQTILLCIVYILGFGPIAFLCRVLQIPLLDMKWKNTSTWENSETNKSNSNEPF